MLDIHTVLKRRREALRASRQQYAATGEIPAKKRDQPTATERKHAQRVVKTLKKYGKDAFPDYVSMECRLDLDASSEKDASGAAVVKDAKRAARTLCGYRPEHVLECWSPPRRLPEPPGAERQRMGCS